MLKRAIRDLFLVLAVGSAAGIFASLFDIRHAADGPALGQLPWQPEELTVVALALAGGLAWFGSRRLTDRREETSAQRREGAQPQEGRLPPDQGAPDHAGETPQAETTWRCVRDPLTSALSHGAVMDALTEHLSANPGAPCSVAMVDVEGMKATNDTYGHQIGDAVLVTVSRALATDGAITGRYSGDEFIAILPGADRDEAERYRDAVLASLGASAIYHPGSGTRVPVSVTIGLAVYPSEAERPEDVVRLADSAMYASRREEPEASTADEPQRLLDKERAARLVAEIVPLLTRSGSREDKLRLVAHHLSVGAGYDAVNFEVAGERPEVSQTWERAFARAPKGLVDAWMHVQGETDDHPLSQLLERTRRPVFLDQLEHDDRLTDAERGLLAVAGLRSALVVPMIWQDNMVGMLSVCSKKEAAFSSWDAEFLTAIASQVTAIVFMTTLVDELQLASANLRQAHSETVMMLAAAAEAYDNTTGRHLQRVRATTEALARALGYTDEQAQDLGLASVLHDIGKIRVPDSVLKSSEKLSDDEWRLMKQHPIWGGEFLSGRPGFELAELIARSHHERWDGRGYPYGLSGDDVPEAATIVSVADSFDAITSDRPYRAGRSGAEAVKEIVACSGEQFSPRVVDALVRLQQRGALPLVEADILDKEAAA